MINEEVRFKTALQILEEQGRVGIRVRKEKLSSLESPLLNKERHASFKNFSEDASLSPNSQKEDNPLVKEKSEDPSPLTKILSPKISGESEVMVKEISDQEPPSKILSPNNIDGEPSLVKEKSTVVGHPSEEILSPKKDNESSVLVKENLEGVTSLENLSPDDVKHQLVQGKLKLMWKGEIYQFAAIEGQGICAGGSLFLRMIRCGKKCRGCPHGPYLIEKRKIAGVWKQRCIGKANRLGAL